MIDVGILTPHWAAGADDELCVMVGEDVRTRVRRISELPDGSAPTSPEELRAHADPSLDERERIARLADRWDVPVCSTPASAVDALRRLGAERLAIVHPPWFGDRRPGSRGARRGSRVGRLVQRRGFGRLLESGREDQS